MAWVRVHRDRPCEVCKHPDYCTRATDGTAVKCMRVESGKPIKSGGWIHKLTDPIPVQEQKAPKKLKDVGAVAKKMFEDSIAPAKRKWLAERLGVGVGALEAMGVGVGWDKHSGREFASFPARDRDGTVVGITRRYDDGEKKTMAGTSNSGVFVAENWWSFPGAVLVVEGGSDVAALYTYGFPAIGRPSNIGGAKVVAAFLKRRAHGRKVIVVGENDRKQNRVGKQAGCPLLCPGCSWCWPGRFGASVVAGELGATWAMVPPRWKDVREWSREPGFDMELFDWTMGVLNERAIVRIAQARRDRQELDRQERSRRHPCPIP